MLLARSSKQFVQEGQENRSSKQLRVESRRQVAMTAAALREVQAGQQLG